MPHLLCTCLSVFESLIAWIGCLMAGTTRSSLKTLVVELIHPSFGWGFDWLSCLNASCEVCCNVTCLCGIAVWVALSFICFYYGSYKIEQERQLYIHLGKVEFAVCKFARGTFMECFHLAQSLLLVWQPWPFCFDSILLTCVAWQQIQFLQGQSNYVTELVLLKTVSPDIRIEMIES